MWLRRALEGHLKLARENAPAAREALYLGGYRGRGLASSIRDLMKRPRLMLLFSRCLKGLAETGLRSLWRWNSEDFSCQKQFLAPPPGILKDRLRYRAFAPVPACFRLFPDIATSSDKQQR